MTVLKDLQTLKSRAPEKVTVNFKVVKGEANEIREKAKKYTKGNVTALIRIAVKKFSPKISELVVVKAPKPSKAKRKN